MVSLTNIYPFISTSTNTNTTGLAYGISLGFRENRNDVTLQGTIGLIFGLNVITFLPIMYLNLYLNAQTDSYKGLNFVGVPNALALMMLVWIIFFTMAHEEEEIAFGNAFIQSVVKSAVGDDSDGDVVAEIVAPVQVEDSEF
jgi:hypothetical protein